MDEKQSIGENQSIAVILNGATEFSAVPYSKESDNFLVMASLKAPYYEETKRLNSSSTQ
jgi:hypothetical protein